jgi:hypothetical protein
VRGTMKPKSALFASAILLVVALPVCTVAGVAAAQDMAPPAPPATYVATVAPVYYGGQPMYWYLNHWYWRAPNGAWSYYRQEPAFLHEHRMRMQPVRHIQEFRGGGRRR